jgi:very-long-chain (3R)-3-hydroxyacyl-CoA dehydratase
MAEVQKKQGSSLKHNYLILYNAVSAAAWLVVFWRAVLTARFLGTEHVYDELADFWKWTQTLAGLEVLHALFGMFLPLDNDLHQDMS